MLNAQQIQWLLQELATRPVLPMNGAQAKQAMMNQMIVEQQLEQDLKGLQPQQGTQAAQAPLEAEAPPPKSKPKAVPGGQRKAAQGAK